MTFSLLPKDPLDRFDLEIAMIQGYGKILYNHIDQNKDWASKEIKGHIGRTHFPDGISIEGYVERLIECASRINGMLLANPNLVKGPEEKKQIQVPYLLSKKIEIAKNFFAPTDAKQDLLTYLQTLIDESKKLGEKMNIEGSDTGIELISCKTALIFLVLTVMYVFYQRIASS